MRQRARTCKKAGVFRDAGIIPCSREPSLVPRPFFAGGKKRHCSRMRGIFRKILFHVLPSIRCTYPSNIQFPIYSSSLVHAYTIGTSSTACLSQAEVYSHTNRETCVSSPVEHGTSLQKLTATIISKERHIQRLFKTQLHSRSRQRSRSSSKTLRHS